jgi:hypothetical protein
MGLFGKKKDWNVIAIMFERSDIYRVNANRAKGSAAVKVRDGSKNHERTIFWAVFDQDGAFVEGGSGPGARHVTSEIVQRLQREIHTLTTVRDLLRILEQGERDKGAKMLEWKGYPAKGD